MNRKRNWKSERLFYREKWISNWGRFTIRFRTETEFITKEFKPKNNHRDFSASWEIDSEQKRCRVADFRTKTEQTKERIRSFVEKAVASYRTELRNRNANLLPTWRELPQSTSQHQNDIKTVLLSIEDSKTWNSWTCQ